MRNGQGEEPCREGTFIASEARPHQIEKTLDQSFNLNLRSLKFRCWQRAIFPGGGPPSIVTVMSLYDRVADFA